MLQQEVCFSAQDDRSDEVRDCPYSASMEVVEGRIEDIARQLEIARSELKSFNYAVAHDLRAPLRHINGFVQILEQEAGPTLNESCREYIQTIRKSAEYMGQLIDGLLLLSRVTSEEMARRECSLEQIVREVLVDCKAEIGNRDIDWRIGKLPTVECDPVLMRQALTYLLKNGIKFTQTRQPAVIEIGVQVIDGEDAIFIRDNGIGFDMAHVGKLFKIFQRLHTPREFAGAGVGLALARRILERHGGRIWAHGEVNAGATFYFVLPRCAK